MSLTWQDTREIAEALYERFPDTDPKNGPFYRYAPMDL